MIVYHIDATVYPMNMHMVLLCSVLHNHPDSKVHGANMGPVWGQQDPGGPHIGHMKLAIWADHRGHNKPNISSMWIYMKYLPISFRVHVIAPVPVKEPWRIWVKSVNTKPQQNSTKQSMYLVHISQNIQYMIHKLMTIFWATSDSTMSHIFMAKSSKISIIIYSLL